VLKARSGTPDLRPPFGEGRKSDTLIHSFKKLKNGKADLKTLFTKKKASDAPCFGTCQGSSSGGFVPLLGDTGSPDNEQQSLTQSQLLIYVFFTCCSPNSANPSPFPRCKPLSFPTGPQPSQQHPDLQDTASSSGSTSSWRNLSSCWWGAVGACGS
jgi:hypothetical protein